MSARQEPAPVPEWRAIQAGEITWASWGDDHVAFHRPSGRTHLLNTATALLLTNILVEFKNARSAADELATAQEAEGDAAFFAEVERVVQRLEQLGLVERRDR